MMKSPEQTIDRYISEQAEEVHTILIKKIREVIRAATEKMSWRMPTFWQPTVGSRGENLIHFAAFKKHISIFPGKKRAKSGSRRCLRNYGQVALNGNGV